ASPEALQQDVGRYLSGPAPRIHRHGQDTDLAARHRQIVGQLDTLKQAWLTHAGEIEALIASSGIAKNKYRGDWVSKWVADITAWALRPTTDYQYPDSLARFAQSRLHEATKKGECPSLPLFMQIELLCEQTLTLRDIVLAQAITELRVAMQRHKLERGEMSFDDLLTRLSQALQQETGTALAEAIRQRYPVAMIDEFQDTDPQQYHIFRTLYGERSDTGLLMIGDPKQAIYAFRGADIFTYIEARRNVSAHYTLETNWRSSAGMVAAVNRLFSLSPDPFLFRDDIPFSAVQASPAASGFHFSLDQQVLPALHLCRLPGERCNSGDYQQQMAAACADSIAGWLQAGAEGRAQIVRGQTTRPVAAQDIAVLVRTGREAAWVRQALSARGVASVYLSNRDSVFGSAEATDLLRLLQACLQPGQERLLRAALASSLLGLSAAQLDALNQDEERWEQVVAEFETYRRCWQRQGVLPMLHLVLRQRQLAENLLAGLEGERRLTNLLHLGELLQEAAAELDSEHALLRWFALQLAEPAYGSDEQQLRLESDAHLVKIVTIHKSKGLEYGLVWLPFACGFRKADGSLYHDEALRPVLDLTGDPQAAERAEHERLAEDIRLIYVALTRAIYHCTVGVAALTVGNGKRESTDLHQSAFGYLLQQGQAGDAALLARSCAQLCDDDGAGNIALTELPAPAQFSPPVADDAPALAAAVFTGQIDRNWWITSYSHLSRHQEAVDWLPHFDQDAAGEQPAAAMAMAGESSERLLLPSGEALYPEPLASASVLAPDIMSHPESAPDMEPETEPVIEYSPFTFPRGARPGTFLHSLFEALEFTAPDSWPAPLAQMSEAHGLDVQWQPVLQRWLEQVLATPLDGEQLRLNQLGPQDRRVELEFYLPIDSPLQAARLDSLCRRYDPLT
ncbi:MAG: exodeoxyribonuclease V subunit beta, partial [Plesiomonas sp.]